MATSMTPDYFWALLIPNTSQTLHSIILGVMSYSFDRKSRKDWKHLFCMIRFYSQENLILQNWYMPVFSPWVFFGALCIPNPIHSTYTEVKVRLSLNLWHEKTLHASSKKFRYWIRIIFDQLSLMIPCMHNKLLNIQSRMRIHYLRQVSSACNT